MSPSPRLAAVLLLAVVHAPFLALAQPAEVEGSGEAAVIGENAVSARRRALAAAAADALTRAIVALIGDQVAAREASRLRPLRERAQQLLRSYRVLEERHEGARFRLKLAASVDDQRLRRELGALGLAPPPPRAVAGPTLQLVVRGEESLARHAGLALREALAREGVTVVDGGAGTSGAAIVACPAPASCLEATLGAGRPELVRGLALQATRVELSLSLRLPGAPAFTRRGEAWGFGEGALASRHALGRALALTLGPVLGELHRRHPPRSRTVRLAGLASWPQLEALERALDRLAGVNACRLDEVAGGEARFAVETSLGAQALAAACEKLAPPGFSLTISRIEGGTLWLSVRPAPASAPSAP